jgi:uncharacterized protein YecE (DUF72 family)
VFVYFDNDIKVRAPYDAMSLAGKLAKRRLPARRVDAVSAREAAASRRRG